MDEHSLGRAVFHDGDILFMEGDPADTMYLIHSGQVELIKRSDDGFFDTLELRGPGQVLGESSLASARPHTMGARASGDVRAIVVKRSMLSQKLDAADPFIQALFRILVRNLMSVMDLQAEIKAPEVEKELDALNDHVNQN